MSTTKTDIPQLISQLTLEEKASLCSGQDEWSFKAIERLGIPSIWVADGPHGVRKAPTSDVGGFGDQHPATCYPTASALSATWDKALLHEVGEHLATECQALGVNVLLGPGVNIKRSPTGGRNFEYFSEDPVLSGELGAAYINGVQSRGVGTSLKHFACNSQETSRMVVSAEVDERTLREIYLPNFEIAVKKAQPWTVMAAYNPVNGTDATANVYLLDQILKQEWGFEGIVISDWVSVFERVEGVKAGMHVEMPGLGHLNDKKIVEAVRCGELDERQLDKLVGQILHVVFKAKALERQGVTFSSETHHAYARKVAGEAGVLLKNSRDVLPVSHAKYHKLALVGEFAVAPRFQGNGSSEVKPTHLDNAKDEIVKLAGSDVQVDYAQGYKLSDDNDTSLIAEAVELAAAADIAVLHVGLPQHYESEGYDRKHIDIPPAQVALIEAVAKVQKNTVVVLTNGSAVAMPWVDQVAAVLETWLGGQAGGGAIADLLFGVVNPSGKLAETFPQRMQDTPAYLDYPGQNGKLHYGEGIFTGYRWYEKRDITPLFPFGHGLSYTRFEYSDLQVSREHLSDVNTLQVSCTVTNTGPVGGKEVVQLYITDKGSRLPRPVKELKGFEKIALDPGESKQVQFKLNPRDFAYYDDLFNARVVESGEFDILLGASSQDIRLDKSVTVNGETRYPVPFDARSTLRDWCRFPETRELLLRVMAPFYDSHRHEFEGELKDFKPKNDFLLDMPLCKYGYLSRGSVTPEAIEAMVAEAQQLTVRL